MSVTITLFNGAAWIEQTLESVLAQDMAVREIVVVDDGSKDDGAERARRFPGVRVVPSIRKLRARHTGLLNTSADLVAFLDQDDLWHPGHLRNLRGALAAEADAPASYSTLSYFYGRATPSLDAEVHGRSRVDPWATWPVRCPITTPSAVLFRRSALDAVGGWTAEAAPDWEIYLRLTTACTLVHVDAATCGYRLHPSARSTDLRRDGYAYLDIQRRGADASLAWRQERGVDAATQAQLLREREILEHLEVLMRATQGGDAEAAAGAARRIERDTHGESDEYADCVFTLLQYLFCPDESPESYQRHRARLLSSLRDVWPDDAPRTKALLGRHGFQQFRWRRLVRMALRGRWGEARRQWRDRRLG